MRPGILLDGGRQPETDQPGTAHYRVYRAEVVNNTLVDASIKLGSNKPLAPVDCVVANNLLQGGAVEGSGENARLAGNLVEASALAQEGPIWRPGPTSPALDRSGPGFDYVRLDIDGQPRARPDVGADERSPDPASRRGPLTPADVGPDAP